MLWKLQTTMRVTESHCSAGHHYNLINDFLRILNERPWWLSGKESACQCRRRGFDPWVGKIPLEEEMATHSSILAQKIPWTMELGRLPYMGGHKE